MRDFNDYGFDTFGDEDIDADLEDMAASAKQVEYLRGLGSKLDLDHITVEQADAEIKRLRNKCTQKQEYALRKYCGKSKRDVEGINREMAKDIIDREFTRRGWNKAKPMNSMREIK